MQSKDPVAEALPMTVEEYLNSTNYKEDPTYVPSDFALIFVNFIKLVNGGQGEENKTPIVHYRMLDTITHGGNRIINLCHRGVAKTTLMAEYLELFIAVYGEIPVLGKVNLMLYVSDSIENGVKNFRKNVEHRYNNSEFLQQYLPPAGVKFTDIRHEFENLSGHKLIVKGYGAQTGVRGAKELGTRPQLAILDDLVSDDDARSATVIESIESTIYKAIEYALHPTKNMIIWSGTPFNSKDPLYKAVESGAWAVNVFPVCEVFPCSREDFRGSWPDRFDYDYVLKQYEHALKANMISTFNQELMLRIMSEEDRMIRDEDIQWYDSAELMAVRNNFNFYITTDFATSVKQHADFSVISVWAYNSNGDWFWVDGVCTRQYMDQTINDLFNLSQEYKPQLVGLEVSGQQAGFVRWIQQEQLKRNQWFTLASDQASGEPGIRPNTNKMVRFNTVVPWFKAKKIYLPKDKKKHPFVMELINELSLISMAGFKSKHDDAADTVSMLASLNAWKPSSEATMSKAKDSNIWLMDNVDSDSGRLNSYIV